MPNVTVTNTCPIGGLHDPERLFTCTGLLEVGPGASTEICLPTEKVSVVDPFWRAFLQSQGEDWRIVSAGRIFAIERKINIEVLRERIRGMESRIIGESIADQGVLKGKSFDLIQACRSLYFLTPDEVMVAMGNMMEALVQNGEMRIFPVLTLPPEFRLSEGSNNIRYYDMMDGFSSEIDALQKIMLERLQNILSVAERTNSGISLCHSGNMDCGSVDILATIIKGQREMPTSIRQSFPEGTVVRREKIFRLTGVNPDEFSFTLSQD